MAMRVSGGSTLTMQAARLLEPRGHTLAAKLRQIYRADRNWRRASPRSEILEIYLALAPYGGNVEGLRAASLAWFGKEPRRLSIGEAALLVALPQAPEARRPDHAPGPRPRRPRPGDRPRAAPPMCSARRRRRRAKAEPIRRCARKDFPNLAAQVSRPDAQGPSGNAHLPSGF